MDRLEFGKLLDSVTIPGSVKKIDIPVYFVMGRYDGMTSPEAAEEYLQSIEGAGEKAFVLFEESAHYPQLEEKEKFNDWMRKTFLERGE